MKPEITILLSIYKDAPFLKDLLDSLEQQTYRNFIVLCRFDGGKDNRKNKDILNKYPFVQILEDESREGITDSYGTLLRSAGTEVPYLMFADQDDVWDPDKVEETLQLMKKTEAEFPGKPVLCHTDLKVVSEDLKEISPSFQAYQSLNCTKKSFRHVLIQNNVTGCTIMINQALSAITAFPKGVICHDWYIALVASAFGVIAYHDRPLISYRQHSGNYYGAVPRKQLFAGIFAKHHLRMKIHATMIQAETFLNQYRNVLSEDQKKMLSAWADCRKEPSYLKRLATAWKYRLVKNDLIRTLGMWWAV